MLTAYSLLCCAVLWCQTQTQVYKPGSTSPAAQLLDARDLFDAGSARSDKVLRQLSGQLHDAVVACAAAAGEALWDTVSVGPGGVKRWEGCVLVCRTASVLRQLQLAAVSKRKQLSHTYWICLHCCAGLDLSVVRQRALLRAAVFGRAFAADVPRDLLRSTALKLRLLNALREPDVGLPLTMPQLEALSLPVVVSRWVGGRGGVVSVQGC